MDPRPVKNYLWVLIIAMMIVIALLSGCSSAPRVQAQKPQYCYTSQTIQTQNGEKVDSKTTVECTDDQIKRMPAVRLGMASNCGTVMNRRLKGSHYVQEQGITCLKADGTWEIIGTH